MIANAELMTVPFERINPAPYNPRKDLKPGDKEWKDIEASLKKFGFVQPLVWNKKSGNLVGGHQRLKILQHHAWTESICTIVDLEPDDEKQLNIILNKLGEGAWNRQRLSELLAELKTRNVDLESLGFTKPDLNKLLKTKPKKHKQDPDAPHPKPTEWSLSREGDIYDIVNADATCTHRLICGDSRNISTLDKLMLGNRAQLLFMDPPYGVAYLNNQRGSEPTFKPIENDALERTALQEFLKDLFLNAHAHTEDNAALYTFLASKTHIPFELALEAAGWKVTHQIIWKKGMVISRRDYHWAHEPMLYARKEGKKRQWLGDRSQQTIFVENEPEWKKMTRDEAIKALRDLWEQSTMWEGSRDSNASLVHPTQKPIFLAKRAMQNNTKAGDIVMDLCSGSGSTLIAAEESDRHARVAEKDPVYCDVGVRRYMQTYETWTVLRNGKEITLADFERPAA